MLLLVPLIDAISASRSCVPVGVGGGVACVRWVPAGAALVIGPVWVGSSSLLLLSLSSLLLALADATSASQSRCSDDSCVVLRGVVGVVVVVWVAVGCGDCCPNVLR